MWEASYRGIREEHGLPEMYMSGLFERAQAYWPDDEGKLACGEAAYCELLLSGVTTLADLSRVMPGWVELAAKSGLRMVLAPGFASARWVVRRSHLLEYEWNEDAGRRGMDDALKLVDSLATHPSGRLSGMISPAQIDTCTEDLLRDRPGQRTCTDDQHVLLQVRVACEAFEGEPPYRDGDEQQPQRGEKDAAADHQRGHQHRDDRERNRGGAGGLQHADQQLRFRVCLLIMKPAG